MDEIKRYDAVCMGYDDARFEEEPEGEWVTYSDHKAALAAKEAELQAEREKVKYYHDKNQEKCAEIDTLRQELAALRGSLAARRSYSFFAG